MAVVTVDTNVWSSEVLYRLYTCATIQFEQVGHTMSRNATSKDRNAIPQSAMPSPSMSGELPCLCRQCPSLGLEL